MGKFIINQTETGYVFHLRASNGEVIATSEVYKTKGACLNGVKSVIANAPKANIEDQTAEGFEKAKLPKFEIYTDKAGEFQRTEFPAVLVQQPHFVGRTESGEDQFSFLVFEINLGHVIGVHTDHCDIRVTVFDDCSQIGSEVDICSDFYVLLFAVFVLMLLSIQHLDGAVLGEGHLSFV